MCIVSFHFQSNNFCFSLIWHCTPILWSIGIATTLYEVSQSCVVSLSHGKVYLRWCHLLLQGGIQVSNIPKEREEINNSPYVRTIYQKLHCNLNHTMIFLINDTQILKEINKRKTNKKEDIRKSLLYLTV